MIRNLVDNAVKFTHNGTIELSAAEQQGSILLSIDDSGPGIALQEQTNIFREFTQLNNPERDRQHGLGLGLAIVKRLCELMTIEIHLSSTPGKGTCFSLSLPMGKTAEVSHTSKGTRVYKKLFNEIILVIDDEMEIRQATRQMIERWHATVVDAENVDDAIDALDQLSLEPTLILSDLRLRDNQSGIDAIKKIQEEFNSDIDAILITGDTSPESLALANSSGIPVLNKPVSPALLHQKIHFILDRD